MKLLSTFLQNFDPSLTLIKKQFRSILKEFGLTENKELLKLLSDSHEVLFNQIFMNKFDKNLREETEKLENIISETIQMNQEVDP